MSQNDSHEPVTVTDKRRIDPETGEVRDAGGHRRRPPSGPAPEAAAAGAADGQSVGRSRRAERPTLQRVQGRVRQLPQAVAARPAAGRRTGQGRRRHPTACRCSTISTAPAATATWSRVR